MIRSHVRAMLAAAAMAGLTVTPACAGRVETVQAPSAAMNNLLDYVHNQNTTGFLIIPVWVFLFPGARS